MSTENAKESAFPNSWTVEKRDGSVVTTIVHGLTKREYYTGLAMQALLSAKGYIPSYEIASDAVDYADALLLELEKPV